MSRVSDGRHRSLHKQPKVQMKKTFIASAIVLCIALSAPPAYSAPDGAQNSERPWPVWRETPTGRPGNAKDVSHTVHIDIGPKMRINPAKSTIRRGDTVRFVITNSANDIHEMVIGTMDDIETHGGLMASFPGMVEHAGAEMTLIQPGKTREVVWQFTEVGEFNFACIIPQHPGVSEVGKIFVIDK